MWGLLGLLGLLGFAGTAAAATGDNRGPGRWRDIIGGGGGGDDDDDDDNGGGGTGEIFKGFVPTGKPTPDKPTPDKPTPDKPTPDKPTPDIGKSKIKKWVKKIKPDEPVDPGGPKPNDIWDLIKDYPTPSTYYQVLTGDSFTGDQGIATRLARTALYQAATEVGGLSVAEANAWASDRLGYTDARRPVTQWIACAPFNDATYATYAFSDKSIPGQQGRAIRLLNQHADNALRIAGGEPPIRNVRLCAPGDPPSCSGSPVDGDFRKRELLWMPGFDLQALWNSNGKLWRPGGQWGDGTSKILPPPKIWALGLIDLSGSGLSMWGCSPYTEAIT
jgi:hypothetical protein